MGNATPPLWKATFGKVRDEPNGGLDFQGWGTESKVL